LLDDAITDYIFRQKNELLEPMSSIQIAKSWKLVRSDNLYKFNSKSNGMSLKENFDCNWDRIRVVQDMLYKMQLLMVIKVYTYNKFGLLTKECIDNCRRFCHVFSLLLARYLNSVIYFPYFVTN
jgi:hypothetical protein